jgi:hypothetical protein
MAPLEIGNGRCADMRGASQILLRPSQKGSRRSKLPR